MKFTRERLAEHMRELRRRKTRKLGRELNPVTVAEVARAVGVDEQTIANYESGASSPSYETAWRLADYYGVTLDGLAGRPSPKGERR